MSIVWVAITVERRRAGLLTPPSGPGASLLLVLMYGAAIAGAACYFLRRTWWLGTVPRVMIDSALVGGAFLLMTASLLPTMVTHRLPGYAIALWIPAFDLAAVFAFATVAIRYRRYAGPLLPFALLSVVCLLLGDLALTVQLLFRAGVPRGYASFPLYALHHMLLARGAYLSLAAPPTAAVAPEPMPFSDWFLWALAPRAAAIAALTAAVVTGAAPHAFVWLVVGLIVAREALAWRDLYRVAGAFQVAQAQLLQATQRTRAFLMRIAHDLGIALQALWSASSYLPLSQDDAQEARACLESLSQLSQSVRDELALRRDRVDNPQSHGADGSSPGVQPASSTSVFPRVLLAAAALGVMLSAIWHASRSGTPVAVQALSPLIALSAMVLLVRAAQRSRACYCSRLWQLQAFVVACSVILMGLMISEPASEAASAATLPGALVMFACLSAGLGLVAYLPQHFWQVTSMQRLLVESVAVSSAVLAILGLAAPRLWASPPHALSATAFLPLALGLGMLYLAVVVGWSTRRRGGRLETMLCLALLCLVFSTGAAALAFALPETDGWQWLAAAGFSLQYVLLALAARHQDVAPSGAPAPSLAEMPLPERLLWTAVARGLAVAAVALVALGAPPLPGTLQWLLLITIGREVLAARDQRRVLGELAAAKRQAQQANADMFATLDRIGLAAATPLAQLWQSAHLLDRHDSMSQMFWEQLAHIERLVSQLQIYVQARTVPLVLTTVDLAPICIAAAQAAQDLADAAVISAAEAHADVRTVLVFETANITVRGDPTAIRRVLDNLLANAVRAMLAARSAGTVDLAIRDEADPGWVVISVSDQGAGVPPELQGHIFEPHVGMGRSGMGLGLAIVSELVAAMGGTYGLTSQIDEPAVFSVRLPRAKRERSSGAAGDSGASAGDRVEEREVGHADRARD